MRVFTLLVTFLLLVSCASDRIDTAVNQCCVDDKYETFTVRSENIPAFLGPLMVSNFSVAMANQGLQPVTDNGDLVATLRYEQDTLSEQQPKDDFDEPMAMGTGQRFIARIAIEVRDARTDEIVYSGQVQRLHDVAAGEWMHTGRASQAILTAFDEVLANFRE